MSINYWMSGLEVQYNTQYCSHCGEAGLAHYHLLKRDQVSEVGGGGQSACDFWRSLQRTEPLVRRWKEEEREGERERE